jgi:hypothetical protein
MNCFFTLTKCTVCAPCAYANYMTQENRRFKYEENIRQIEREQDNVKIKNRISLQNDLASYIGTEFAIDEHILKELEKPKYHDFLDRMTLSSDQEYQTSIRKLQTWKKVNNNQSKME